MRGRLFWGVIFLAIIGMNFSFAGIAFADDLIVIGNRSVPVASLTPTEVQEIYLGKMKVWDNGQKIMLVILKNSEITDRFLKEYVKKNYNVYDNYWKKQLFIGAGKPPKVFQREKDLLEYVSETKGAVGYINSQSYNDSVKILSVTH